MKPFLTIVLCICFVCGKTQTSSNPSAIHYYYDSNWHETTKDSSYYNVVITKNGALYDLLTYWTASGKLKRKAVYTDTSYTKPTGIAVDYYPSGLVADTTKYDEQGRATLLEHYTEKGVKDRHAYLDKKEGCLKAVRYDSLGKQLPGEIVYEKKAMFPGGLDGWVTYLQTHLKADTPTRKKAPAGNYTVMVSFLVTKEGKISEVKAENDPGYGTAQEAVRVIKSGPNWIPAIQEDKAVTYRAKQSITFQVIEEKR